MKRTKERQRENGLEREWMGEGQMMFTYITAVLDYEMCFKVSAIQCLLPPRSFTRMIPG